jgi:signal transduction histidine kinase
VRRDGKPLQADSTVADLFTHDFRVLGSALGEQIFVEFERQPVLPGVIVEMSNGPEVMVSRGRFFQLLSKGFGREIFLRRPIQVLYHTMDQPCLRVSANTPIGEAAAAALKRPFPETYEPLLLEGNHGVLGMLDVHDLLQAQSELLSLSNRLVAQKVEALEDANRALREAQAALVQSEKLASLGQLAAGVAHEINNPVAFVSNNLAVLKREMDSVCKLLDQYRQRLGQADPPAGLALKRTEEEVDLPYIEEHRARQFRASQEGLGRVSEIVRNLCDFARLNQAEREQFDLNAGLRSTLEMLVHEKKKRNIDVETDLGDLPFVEGYPGKINQVLLNLILNAMQACQDSGKVRIATYRDRGGVCVEVRDNGCGIPPENRPRLFDPFFTTKPVGQGTGLGLSISFGIIRDHGGTIEVESALGAGSVFRVRLPVVQSGPAPSSMAARREPVAGR